MDTKDMAQTIILKASPHDVYEALMDSQKHSEFTGAEANISREVGGEFTAWDGYIVGTNLVLEADRHIVQEWRATDWPEGVSSTVTFLLDPAPEGTKLSFTQKGIPEEFYEDIVQGWTDYYWEPMKEMLEG